MAKTIQITKCLFGGGLNSLNKIQTVSGSTSSILNLRNITTSSTKDTPPATAETCRVHTDPAAPDVPVPKTVQKAKLSFNWKDPLDLESKLTDEEKLVRDTAYSYCQEKLVRDTAY